MTIYKLMLLNTHFFFQRHSLTHPPLTSVKYGEHIHEGIEGSHPDPEGFVAAEVHQLGEHEGLGAVQPQSQGHRGQHLAHPRPHGGRHVLAQALHRPTQILPQTAGSGIIN